jgi:hypothetical protein
LVNLSCLRSLFNCSCKYRTKANQLIAHLRSLILLWVHRPGVLTIFKSHPWTLDMIKFLEVEGIKSHSMRGSWESRRVHPLARCIRDALARREVGT